MDQFDYAITLDHVPNYGRVKVLFGLKSEEYQHTEGRTFVIDIEEIKTKIQYLSLKSILQQKGHIE